MSSNNRGYVEDVINTYFEMGNAALERKEFAIAQKMFRAVFEEPGSKAQKERIMLPLLVKSAQAHEGMKQFYKAKLLYIRALALKGKSKAPPDMQTVEILLTLAHLTAQQGLYRQAVDFAEQAFQAYRRCTEKDAIEFVKNLRRTEKIMELKARQAEQQKLLEMLKYVRDEALSTIAVPAFSATPVAQVLR